MKRQNSGCLPCSCSGGGTRSRYRGEDAEVLEPLQSLAIEPRPSSVRCRSRHLRADKPWCLLCPISPALAGRLSSVTKLMRGAVPCRENPEANFEPSKGRAGAPGAGSKLRKCQSGALLPILALCLSLCSGEFLGEAFLRKLPAQAACDRTDIPFAWRRCCPLAVSRPPFGFCPWEQLRGHIGICLLSAASGSS